MAENVTLAPVSSFTNDSSAVATVNANNALIESAFEDCLSLSGDSPNQMQSNLDMNSNQILNLPAPASVNSPARLIDIVSNPTLALTIPPIGTSGATVPLLNTNVTFSGNNTYSGTSTFTGTTNLNGTTLNINNAQFGTWTYSAGNSGPNLILYNGRTAGAGSSVGGGVLFNCNNSAGAFHTAAFYNGGYRDNTAGAERGDLDLAIWDGQNATNRILSLTCDGTKAWFGPDVDNYYQLGLSGFKWSLINTVALTATGTITAPNLAISSTSTTTGITNTGTLTNTGNITATGSIKSSSASAGVGYATGAGSAVTQLTNKTTGVTINTPTGQITMNNASLGSTVAGVAFTVTNSSVAATDSVIVGINNTGATANAYFVSVHAIQAGSFAIKIVNTSGGALSEAVIINYAIIKGVAA